MSQRVKLSVVRSLVLSFISGGALSLSFLNSRFWWCCWFGFLPLFFALRRPGGALRAFFLSYCAGLVFWSATLYWLACVSGPGLVILVLYLALYFAAFGWAVSVLSAPWSFVFLPSLWVCLEYLRGHILTGFPWAILGYSQYRNLPIIQIADITGAYGVSFLLVMANLAVYSIVGGRRTDGRKTKDEGRRTRKPPSSLVPRPSEAIVHLYFVLCLLLILGYGYFRLGNAPSQGPARRASLKVSLIQPNIPQEIKWSPGAKEGIVQRYLGLSQKAEKTHPDLIIWPETAVSDYLQVDKHGYIERGVLRGFPQDASSVLLLGLVTVEGDRFYNSALLVSSRGKILGRYDKLHLVPFGEYIPLRERLPFLSAVAPIGDFTPGKRYSLFSLPGDNPGAKFSVLICFEDVFAGLARRFVQNGAGFLVNITNDAWFKDSAEPYQHLAASVFRAVENRVTLLRAANSGISCFVSRKGRIISSVQNAEGKETFVAGQISADIPLGLDKQPSIYTRYGDWFVLVCFIIVGGGIIRGARIRSISFRR